ncbi:MAG: TolC family protein [Treponema sp.]|nr:TolC family protein [Treponema sp.]
MSSAEKDEKITLNVQQAVEYALQNSRSLKTSQLDLEMKERASKYGWNVLLPTLQATGTMNRTTDADSTWSSILSGAGTAAAAQAGNWAAYSTGVAGVESTMKKNESLHWAAVGSVSVSWNFSLAMIQSIRATQAAYEGGKITWEQSQRETTTQIRKMFYGLLLQQENLKIQQTTLENSRQRATQAQTNYRNGSVPELVYLQAQVAYQNLIPDVQQVERAAAQTLDTFAMLLGFPVGTKLELVGEIEPTYVDVDADDLLARYGGNNLDIQALQNNIDQLKMNLSAINLKTWTPALALNYAWQPTLAPYALDFDKWGKSKNWMDKGSFSITLAWNITNMLPWSANRQQAADLKANIAKLELSMSLAQENQKIQVRTAVDTLKQAREQIDVMERNVTLAQRAYEMSARSYRNGTTELLDLRDAEKSLNQAKLGQLNAKNNYISALMDLEKALNTSLTRPANTGANAGAPEQAKSE